MLFLLWPFTMIVGQANLTGVVTDSLGLPLNAVQIYVLALPDSLVIARESSDDSGTFEVKLPTVGQFRLVFQRLAYTKKILEYQVGTNTESQPGYLKVQLQEHPITIPEVLVNAQKPVKRSKDTLYIDVAHYLRGSERVAEDILRQLPGVEVGSDGGIRVRGKVVSQVLIEGDNLFDGQYTLLTRNLDANLIDQVQVLFHYSDNPVLKGIQNTQAIALNISLKDEVKNAWFGQTELGMGLPEQYVVRPNVIQVRKATKTYFLGNLNNAGVPAIANLPGLNSVPTAAEVSHIGDHENLESFFTTAFGNSETVGNRSNFNKAQLGVGSAVLNPVPNLKIRVQTHFAEDVSRFKFADDEIVNVQDLNFRNSEIRNSSRNNREVRYRLNVQFRPKGQQLEWESKGANLYWNQSESLTFNTASLHQRQLESALNQDHRLSYTLGLHNKHAFMVTLRQKEEHRNFGVVLDTAVWGKGNLEQTATPPEQEVNQGLHFSGIETTWLGKRDAWDWKLFASILNRKSYLSAESMGWGKDIASVLQNDEAQKRINSRLYRTFSGLSISHTRRHWVFRSGFALRTLDNHIADNEGVAVKTHQWVPQAGVDWTPNDSQAIFLKYSFDVIETQMLDWFPGWILTGYRNFSSGGGWIRPYRAHNWLFGYTLGSWGDAFQLNTSLYYQQEPRYLGSVMETTPQFSTSINQEFSNRSTYAFNLQVDKYVKSLSGNLKGRLEINQNQFTVVINSTVSPIRTQWIHFGPEWKTLFNGSINFHLGYFWNFSSTLRNRLVTLPSQKGFLDADLNLGTQWHLGISNEVQRLGTETKTNHYIFSDLSATFTSKSGRPVYRLELSNLWNEKAIETKSLTETGYTLSKVPLRPQSALFSVEFKL